MSFRKTYLFYCHFIDKAPPRFLVAVARDRYEHSRPIHTREETEDALMQTALALENYRLKHDSYPATLSQLIPQELPQIPATPSSPSAA